MRRPLGKLLEMSTGSPYGEPQLKSDLPAFRMAMGLFPLILILVCCAQPIAGKGAPAENDLIEGLLSEQADERKQAAVILRERRTSVLIELEKALRDRDPDSRFRIESLIRETLCEGVDVILGVVVIRGGIKSSQRAPAANTPA